MTAQNKVDPGGTVRRESTIHGYYRAQGYESCPKCGQWLLPQTGRQTMTGNPT